MRYKNNVVVHQDEGYGIKIVSDIERNSYKNVE